jgi:DNA-binding Lrp family transcriptional regulator
MKMPTAYVLIKCQTGTQDKILNQLKKVPGIVEVSEVNGVYDIVVKVYSDILDSLKQTITQHIRTIKTITLTMTLIETK